MRNPKFLSRISVSENIRIRARFWDIERGRIQENLPENELSDSDKFSSHPVMASSPNVGVFINKLYCFVKFDLKFYLRIRLANTLPKFIGQFHVYVKVASDIRQVH